MQRIFMGAFSAFSWTHLNGRLKFSKNIVWDELKAAVESETGPTSAKKELTMTKPGGHSHMGSLWAWLQLHLVPLPRIKGHNACVVRRGDVLMVDEIVVGYRRSQEVMAKAQVSGWIR